MAAERWQQAFFWLAYDSRRALVYGLLIREGVRGDGPRSDGFGAPSVLTFVVRMGRSFPLRGTDGPLELRYQLLTQKRRRGLAGN